MNAKTLIKTEYEYLKKYSADAKTEIKIVFEYITGLDFVMSQITENDITDEKAQKIQKLVKRLAKGEPLQYVLGEWSFMGYDFIVSPDVLIPRADTEIVCESVLEYLDNNFRGRSVKVLDLCTGSGCIGISIAAIAKNAIVDCVDISEKALDIADKNIKKNGVSVRVKTICSDMFDKCGVYNVIVSNPPYIPRAIIAELDEKVRCYEPNDALDGGIDGLDFYKKIADEAKKHLMPRGKIFLEIGYDQKESVMKLFSDAGYKNIICKKDYSGNDRMIECDLEEA